AKPLQLDSDWGSYWLERLMIPSGTRFKAFAEAVKRIVDAEPNSSAGRIWEALADSNQEDAGRAFANQVVATEGIIGLCELVFDVCRHRASAESSELSVRADQASQHGYDQNGLQRLRSIEAPHSAELCRFRHIALTSANDSFEMLARDLLNRHRS